MQVLAVFEALIFILTGFYNYIFLIHFFLFYEGHMFDYVNVVVFLQASPTEEDICCMVLQDVGKAALCECALDFMPFLLE